MVDPMGSPKSRSLAISSWTLKFRFLDSCSSGLRGPPGIPIDTHRVAETEVPRTFFASASSDGRVLQWSMKKGLEQTTLMQLKRVPNPNLGSNSVTARARCARKHTTRPLGHEPTLDPSC